MDKQTDRQTDRQTDKQTNIQTQLNALPTPAPMLAWVFTSSPESS